MIWTSRISLYQTTRTAWWVSIEVIYKALCGYFENFQPAQRRYYRMNRILIRIADFQLKRLGLISLATTSLRATLFGCALALLRRAPLAACCCIFLRLFLPLRDRGKWLFLDACLGYHRSSEHFGFIIRLCFVQDCGSVAPTNDKSHLHLHMPVLPARDNAQRNLVAFLVDARRATDIRAHQWQLVLPCFFGYSSGQCALCSPCKLVVW